MSSQSPFRKMWNYVKAALTFKFNEAADPRIQLEQAISDAQHNHKRLKENAANVIAHQKQTTLKLDRKAKELAKLEANARQALLMADEAMSSGDESKALQYQSTAETIATQLVAVEAEVTDLEDLALQAARNSEQAKASVEQSAHLLRQKMAEKQKLVGQIDQAKMHESMNEAMQSLNETVGADVPTFAEVQEKIERRLAQAQGANELEQNSVEVRMMEVERASQNVEAKARLSQLRSELGIGEPAPATAADDATEKAPEKAPEPKGTTATS